MALTPGDTNYQNYVNRICYTKTQLDSGILDSRYFAESEFLAASAGVGSAGAPVKLNSSGYVDSTMISGGDVATHAALTAAHGATGAVVGTTNTQTLTNKTLTSPSIATATLTGATTISGAVTGAVSTHTSMTPTIYNSHAGFGLAADANNQSVVVYGYNFGASPLLQVVAKTFTATPAAAWDPSASIKFEVYASGDASLAGALTSGGVAVPTISSTSTLTNKTLTTPTIASFVNANHTHIATGSSGGAVAHSVLTGAGTNAHSIIDAHLASTVEHGATGAVVGTTNSQTLTNKTLTTPIIATISNTGTLTLPTSTDTLVGRATTDTLTNKTLTAPTITTPIIANIYGSSVNNGDIQIEGTNQLTRTTSYVIMQPGGGDVVIGGSTTDDNFEIQDAGSTNYRLTFDINSAASGVNKIHSYNAAVGATTAADLTLTGSRITLSGARVNVGTTNTPVNGGTPTTGVVGDFFFDTGFLYMCTSANAWKRVAIATF